MKETYVKPEITVTNIAFEDIILTSVNVGGWGNGGIIDGGEAEEI